MALDLVTGYKGAAHITAEDIGAFNAGIMGAGDWVLTSGNKFAASLTSNNTVKILDGDLIIQGRHVCLKKNTYEEVIIENGETDKNRNDLIVARYTKDSTNGIENVEFAVIKGENSASEASDPEYTTGDILSGGCTLHEMPLYRIKLNGLTVGEPEPLFVALSHDITQIRKIVQGVYYGNGPATGTAASISQFIDLGFTPLGVIVARQGLFYNTYHTNSNYASALAIREYGSVGINVKSNGFEVASSHNSGNERHLNDNGERYTFMAWA